jgi:hypothetical protein
LVHAKLAFGNGQFTIDVIDDSPMKTLIYRAFPSHRWYPRGYLAGGSCPFSCRNPPCPKISEAKLLLLAALAGGLWVDTASFNGEAIPCNNSNDSNDNDNDCNNSDHH